jgi:hypothetical protein
MEHLRLIGKGIKGKTKKKLHIFMLCGGKHILYTDEKLANLFFIKPNLFLVQDMKNCWKPVN